MSVERARALIVTARADAALHEKLAGATPAEKKTLLESYGFGDVTAADLRAARSHASGELSDGELQTVAGGTGILDLILDIILGIPTI